MEPETVTADAALRSVESAIAVALRSGADEEDVYHAANTAYKTGTRRFLDGGSGAEDTSRFVNTSTSNVHGRKKRVGKFLDGHRDKESAYFANRGPRFAIVFFAVIVLSIVNSMRFREKEFLQPTQIEVIYVESTNQKEEKKEDGLSGSDFTIQTAISQYNQGAISQFLQNVPVNGLPVNRTENPCPLDVFFHDGCQVRSGGTVCIFPGAIMKRVKDGLWDAEVDAFKVLNDTRFFPELYYKDPKCLTVLQENVNPLALGHSNWCANYTYYEDFYKSAFEIFTANNIIPVDLNTCCNTIVDGDKIRIIDFGRYKLNKPPVEVRLENEKLLKRILEDLVSSIESAKNSKTRCKD